MQRKYNVDNSPPVIHCFQWTVAEFVMQRKNTQWYRPMVSSGERNGMWCKWSHVRPVLVAIVTCSFLKYAIISQTSAHQSEEKRSLGSRFDDYGPCLSFEIFNAAREKRDFSFMIFFSPGKVAFFFRIHGYTHTYEQINALELLSRCEHFRLVPFVPRTNAYEKKIHSVMKFEDFSLYQEMISFYLSLFLFLRCTRIKRSDSNNVSWFQTYESFSTLIALFF